MLLVVPFVINVFITLFHDILTMFFFTANTQNIALFNQSETLNLSVGQRHSLKGRSMPLNGKF